MTDHTNTNGLVDGNVPPGQPCPFLATCGRRDWNCPSEEQPREVPFSCGAARGWSLIKNAEEARDR